MNRFREFLTIRIRIERRTGHCVLSSFCVLEFRRAMVRALLCALHHDRRTVWHDLTFSGTRLRPLTARQHMVQTALLRYPARLILEGLEHSICLAVPMLSGPLREVGHAVADDMRRARGD